MQELRWIVNHEIQECHSAPLETAEKGTFHISEYGEFFIMHKTSITIGRSLIKESDIKILKKEDGWFGIYS